jgi:TRAP-type mannitol/chloroaromatic compound transport system substrate-binding protein
MKIILANLKNTITHNVAQLLVSTGKEGAYDYLGAVAEYLLNDPVPLALGIDMDTANEIYIYAWNHAQEEVDIVKSMYEQHGIEINVNGNGGSQIHPSVMMETLLHK